MPSITDDLDVVLTGSGSITDQIKSFYEGSAFQVPSNISIADARDLLIRSYPGLFTRNLIPKLTTNPPLRYTNELNVADGLKAFVGANVSLPPWIAEANATVALDPRAQLGNNCILLTHATAGAATAYYRDITNFVVGETYEFTAWVKRAAGNQGIALSAQGVTAFTNQHDDWVMLKIQFVASTTTIRVYLFNALNSGAASTGTGTATLIDSILIKRIG